MGDWNELIIFPIRPDLGEIEHDLRGGINIFIGRW